MSVVECYCGCRNMFLHFIVLYKTKIVSLQRVREDLRSTNRCPFVSNCRLTPPQVTCSSLECEQLAVMPKAR